MRQMWISRMVGCGLMLAASGASAAIVRVEATGTVEYNDFVSGILSGVQDGEPVLLTFDVDSNVFVNDPNFPTRGYPIVLSSFRYQIGSVSVPLVNPLPNGATAYFVVRNNDPAVDGFYFSISTSTQLDVPVSIGVPNMGAQFLRTFTNGNIWPTFDILAAQGSWGYEFMSVFHFGIGRGDNTPLGVNYQRISVAVFPSNCPGDLNGDALVDLSDLTALLAHFGISGVATLRDGDLDGDHDVDLSDLTVLLSNFGTSCS